MNLWLWPLIVGALVVQETATVATVFVLALQDQFPIWLIHILWAGITICDMYIGFVVGTVVKRRYRGTRFVQRIETVIEKMRGPLGAHGQALFVIALGIVAFPYLTTFVASWLGVTLKKSLLYTFIANTIWYAVIWITILGAGAFFKDPAALFLAVIVVIVLAELAGKRYVDRKMR